VIYEWHPQKAQRNLLKHGVTFDEAASVFLDPMALTFADPAHSGDEDREITIGVSGKGRAVFVCHCERAERLRIISARKATPKERQQYEQEYGLRER
jgi:uncharacterized DUF497 family protein